MSCEGCNLSPKGQEMNLEAAKTRALAFATENNVTVAVYQEGTDFRLMEAFAAYAAGLAPVIRATISKHQ